MKSYMERINVIADKCSENNVPFSVCQVADGWLIRFPWCEGDVACHSYTYGSKSGYVESYLFPWDHGDVSILKPKKMAKKILKYFKKLNKGKED